MERRNKPSTGSPSILYAITALSSNDVWAVGTYYNGSNGNVPLTIHWDGSSWTQQNAPFTAGTTYNVC